MKTLISEVEVSDKDTSVPLKMLHVRVLLERIKAEKKSEDGVVTKEIEGSKLFAPATANENMYLGKVVSKGEGTKDYPVVVNVGDTVQYFPSSVTPYNFQGKEYDMVNVAELLMIV